jgi:hypothetical protein
MRWTFSKITPRSFRWRGVISKDSGKTWQFQQEMRVHRRGPNPAPRSPRVSSDGLPGLDAAGPSPRIADELMLYGQFVGDWDFDWTGINPDGSKQTGQGEWLFGWVLEGRAVQDVWIFPPRAERAKPNPPAGEYGTTLRFFDPKIQAWRVTWNAPEQGLLLTFTAKKVGNEIVQEGKTLKGLPMRWTFSDITPNSFHWRSVVSADGGKTWQLREEMNVRRRGAANGTSTPEREAATMAVQPAGGSEVPEPGRRHPDVTTEDARQMAVTRETEIEGQLR